MEYTLIVNPVAGAGLALKTAEKVQQILTERGIPFQVIRTKQPGHGTELARAMAEAGKPAVVAIGGDGTVREVAAGLVHTGTALGIIPAGTGNDLVKTAGIPGDPMEALEFLLSHDSREIDTGTVNDRFFLNVCGTGFDVTVLDCTERFKSRFRGLLPYFLGLIRAIFRYQPDLITVEADGYQAEGRFMVCSVANGRFIGGGIPICPVAELTDGKLNFVLIRNVPRWKIPFYLPGLMLSRDLKFRITTHLQSETVRLQGSKLRINIDGEIEPMDEAVFRICPASLKLICKG